MSDDSERVHGVPWPGHAPAAHGAAPHRSPPAPGGTLGEILAGIEAEAPEARLARDLDRIERALIRLEQAMREAQEDPSR